MSIILIATAVFLAVILIFAGTVYLLDRGGEGRSNADISAEFEALRRKAATSFLQEIEGARPASEAAETEVFAEVEVEAEADVAADADAVAGAKVVPEAVAEAGAKVKMIAEADVAAKVVSEADATAETEVLSETESETETAPAEEVESLAKEEEAVSEAKGAKAAGIVAAAKEAKAASILAEADGAKVTSILAEADDSENVRVLADAEAEEAEVIAEAPAKVNIIEESEIVPAPVPAKKSRPKRKAKSAPEKQEEPTAIETPEMAPVAAAEAIESPESDSKNTASAAAEAAEPHQATAENAVPAAQNGETAPAPAKKSRAKTKKKGKSVPTPEDIETAPRIRCTVVSTKMLSPTLKEIRLKPGNKSLAKFAAGDYLEFFIPPATVRFSEIAVDKAFQWDWKNSHFDDLVMVSSAEVHRPYSIASYPGEDGTLLFVIGLALPAEPHLSPGIASSYLFSLREGDTIEAAGPFMEYEIPAVEGNREIVFIGGGTGMVPLRSRLFDILENGGHNGPVSFYYGVSTFADAFYINDFLGLERRFKNFTFQLSMEVSDMGAIPFAEGKLTDVLFDSRLQARVASAPERSGKRGKGGDSVAENDLEQARAALYILCGPQDMVDSVTRLLDDAAVPAANIVSHPVK